MNQHKPAGVGSPKRPAPVQETTASREDGSRLESPHIGRRAFAALAVSALTTAVTRAAAPPSKDELDIDRFIDGAFIKYETVFPLPTTPERFGRMLDNLFVMGALWDAYGFSPRYRVVRLGTVWHVIDPSGLEGILRTVDASVNQRTLIANGKLKNWYIPKTITGRALFFLRYANAPGGISVRFTVYGEGSTNRLEQVMLKAISPLLGLHIGHRVERNLRDLRTIVTDLERNPDETARRLDGVLAVELGRMFEPSAPR